MLPAAMPGPCQPSRQPAFSSHSHLGLWPLRAVAYGRIPRLAAGLPSGPKPLAKLLGAHWPKPLAEPTWMRKVAFLDCCGPLWTAVDCCGLLFFTLFCSHHSATMPLGSCVHAQPVAVVSPLAYGGCRILACGRIPASEFCGVNCLVA